jgi:hypothetical protein
LCRQLFIRDPARPHRVIFPYQPVDLALDAFAIECLIRQIEVESALAVADLAAGDIAGIRAQG